MRILNPFVRKILETLNKNGYRAYLVGGYVRDFLLNKTTNDYDICTEAPPKELKRLFHKEVNDCGSINIKQNSINVDITIFRKEKNYQKRRPNFIQYTNSLKSDLLRRDFTINTLCMDKDGKIIDLLKGKEDLKKQTIRMVGDIKAKIEEDPLRILRAIRFATILNFYLEPSLKREIINNKNLLSTISSYRIKEEISKILNSPFYQNGLDFIKKYDLNSVLGLNYSKVNYTENVLGMWAQIQIKKELPFTKEEKRNIVKIQEILQLKKMTEEVLYYYGLSLSLIAGQILGISKEYIQDLYLNMPIYTRKDLKINFQEICACLNILPSKKGKIVERFLIQEVLSRRVKNTKKDLEIYLIHHKTRWDS